ncbi:MAG: class II aldolase/adducin family protein [bacterium]
MLDQIRKYGRKLIDAGLVEPGEARLYGLDDELIGNMEGDPLFDLFREVFDRLNIMGLVFSPPSALYRKIIEGLIDDSTEKIYPRDCESRTFFHDIPVVHSLDPVLIARALKERRSVIVAGRGIVSFGTVTLEQAFINYSSVIHTTYVKYFVDFDGYMKSLLSKNRIGSDERETTLQRIGEFTDIVGMVRASQRDAAPPTMDGPFDLEEDIYTAISEAGRRTVEAGMVDSFFGNISYSTKDKIYISQTGSSLDELDGCIDPVPFDNSSSVGITASSELPAHKRIFFATGDRAILHGHPKFSIIMSMICDEEGCSKDCATECDRERWVAGVPVVPGEVGAGGLAKTVPPAIVGNPGAIVYGHGVFTTGRTDFREAFVRLRDIELGAREAYLRRQEAHIEKFMRNF